MNIKISVVIVSWNKKKDTLETLRSIINTNLERVSLKVVIVDNGSTDGTEVAIKEFIDKNHNGKIEWKLIRKLKNTGFCEGNNIGIKYSMDTSAEYVMLLNDDTLVSENLFVGLREAFEKFPNAGAISPKILFAKGYEFHKSRYSVNDRGKVIWYAGGLVDWNNVYGSNFGVDEVDKGQYNQVKETDFATGCCVVYPVKVLKKVGLLDENYFAYLEDVDLSMRIKKSGYKVLYYPSVHLWHKVSQSSGIGSNLNDYFITRNRMLFGLRYAPFRAKLALLRESVKLLVSGRTWQRVGIRDFYLFNFKKGSWK